jgi:hypothetical protein
MSRYPYIRILIQPDETCSVDAIDFRGPACRQVTLEIAQVLGDQMDRQQDKPEARLGERGRVGEPEASR